MPKVWNWSTEPIHLNSCHCHGGFLHVALAVWANESWKLWGRAIDLPQPPRTMIATILQSVIYHCHLQTISRRSSHNSSNCSAPCVCSLHLTTLHPQLWHMTKFHILPDIASEISYHSSLLLVIDQSQGCCTMYTISCSEACLDMFGMTRWNGGRGESFSYYAKWSLLYSENKSTRINKSFRVKIWSIFKRKSFCIMHMKSYLQHCIANICKCHLPYFVLSVLPSHSSFVCINLRPVAVYMSSDIHGIRAKHCLWQWPSWEKDSLGHPSARNSQFVGIQHIVWCDFKGQLNWDTINWNPIKFPYYLCWQVHYKCRGDPWWLYQIWVGASSFSPMGSWMVLVPAECLFVSFDPAPII